MLFVRVQVRSRPCEHREIYAAAGVQVVHLCQVDQVGRSTVNRYANACSFCGCDGIVVDGSAIELESGTWENIARLDGRSECHGPFLDGREVVRVPAAMAKFVRRITEGVECNARVNITDGDVRLSECGQ